MKIVKKKKEKNLFQIIISVVITKIKSSIAKLMVDSFFRIILEFFNHSFPVWRSRYHVYIDAGGAKSSHVES